MATIYLPWVKEKLGIANGYLIHATGDDSCFIHAVLRAFFIPYITETLNGKPIKRSEIVRQVRQDLSNRLTYNVYRALSNGHIESYAKETGEEAATFEGMKRNLAKYSYHITDMELEHISNEIGKDIYIITDNSNGVYNIPNRDVLHKNRQSIVLVWNGYNHYDLFGQQIAKDTYRTLFEPTDPVILQIISHMK